MIKCAWLTDIHLNFLEKPERVKFYKQIKALNADAVFISGDIAEAPTVIPILQELAEIVEYNIYFVVGNHDYYHGQVDPVKQQLGALLGRSDNRLYWLPATGPIKLIDEVVLVGQDGWADGRLGDYSSSGVVLNDSRLIADLFQQRILGKFQLLDKMQQLADSDAISLQRDLEQALNYNPKKIVVLTHVPPFRETCLYAGAISGDDWLPFFSSKISGDILQAFALANPNIELLVLCGHTHQYANCKILPNLHVKVGKAEYYLPEIQEVFDF